MVLGRRGEGVPVIYSISERRLRSLNILDDFGIIGVEKGLSELRGCKQKASGSFSSCENQLQHNTLEQKAIKFNRSSKISVNLPKQNCAKAGQDASTGIS
jgi:hypothetical protein